MPLHALHVVQQARRLLRWRRSRDAHALVLLRCVMRIVAESPLGCFAPCAQWIRRAAHAVSASASAPAVQSSSTGAATLAMHVLRGAAEPASLTLAPAAAPDAAVWARVDVHVATRMRARVLAEHALYTRFVQSVQRVCGDAGRFVNPLLSFVVLTVSSDSQNSRLALAAMQQHAWLARAPLARDLDAGALVACAREQVFAVLALDCLAPAWIPLGLVAAAFAAWLLCSAVSDPTTSARGRVVEARMSHSLALLRTEVLVPSRTRAPVAPTASWCASHRPLIDSDALDACEARLRSSPTARQLAHELCDAVRSGAT